MSKGIQLKHLLFTGKGLPPSIVKFDDGLNIVFGGSNAGKSYMLEVLNFLLGGETPQVLTAHGSGYVHALLGLLLPGGRDVTLRRSRKGGGIELFEGAPEDGEFGDAIATKLSASHGQGKDGSVSELLLHAIGIENATIARSEVADKSPFSIRHFIPYVLVDEDRMFSKDSPSLINKQAGPTLSKNVLRFVLTGKDDSDVTTVPSQDTLKAKNAGRVAMLDELIADLDMVLAEVDIKEITEQQERLSSRVGELSREVETAQRDLDARIAERRRLLDDNAKETAAAAHLRTMGFRFVDLRTVYQSDIRRLEAIEEGGFLLRRFEDQPCPLCGALPGHQHKPHALGGLEKQHAAAQAEIAKIRRDLRDLNATLSSMEAEHKGITARVEANNARIAVLDDEIRALRPKEATHRDAHRVLHETLDDLNVKLKAAADRDDYAARKQQIEAIKVGKQSAEGLTVGISGGTGHDFAKVVAEVLEAWKYPGIEAVAFDLKTHDITTNGQARANNGKGVKAIFHSAYVVAALIWCRRRGLPHPGFIVLDSPLVTYRQPIHYEKHGELAEDEMVIAATSLDQAFYDHLAGLGDIAQIIVVENNTPPSKIEGRVKVQTFSGEHGDGREGLFVA